MLILFVYVNIMDKIVSNKSMWREDEQGPELSLRAIIIYL